MGEIERELRTLEGERKMGEVALRGYQNNLAEQLNSSMGQDIRDVLEGKKKVKLSLWQRIKYKFDRLLWNLDLEQ